MLKKLNVHESHQPKTCKAMGGHVMVRNFAEYMRHFTVPPKGYKVYFCTILHKPISNSSLVTALQLKANLMHPPFCHFTLKKI
jgi:hypothetical protein